MSFPNHPNKHLHDSLLDPQDIVGYRRHLGRLPRIDAIESVLFCLEKGLPKRLHRRIPVRFAGSMLGELYQLKRAKTVGVMANFGGGAPIVVELAEELVAMGVKRMVLLTWGGALQPGLEPGDIVICDRAIRDDGTSHHYLPPEKYIQANPGLVARLANAVQSRTARCSIGTTWTTDAPYRETLAEVQDYQEEGVKTVEMESAGLFAVGQVRGIETASAVVIMDSLANLKWEVPDQLDRVNKALETVYESAVAVLGEHIPVSQP